MDFMPLRLNSSKLTCSICALAAIILQLVVMECQKLHMVDSPLAKFLPKVAQVIESSHVWNQTGHFLVIQNLNSKIMTLCSEFISGLYIKDIRLKWNGDTSTFVLL